MEKGTILNARTVTELQGTQAESSSQLVQTSGGRVWSLAMSVRHP